jgi:hypothetical protein
MILEGLQASGSTFAAAWRLSTIRWDFVPGLLYVIAVSIRLISS